MEHKTKICTKCKRRKSLSDFYYVCRSESKKWRPSCKLCINNADKRYSRTEKGKEVNRRNAIKYSRTEKGQKKIKAYKKSKKYKEKLERNSESYDRKKKAKCCRCRKVKSIIDFYRDRSRKSGHQIRCTSCQNTVNLISNVKKHGSKEAYYRYHYLKYTYGISEEEYVELAKSQNWRCVICRKKKELYVDHCHKTFKIRGLLCHKCNTSIGFIGDHAKEVKKFLKYLERSS